jgi:heme-degrading monooxygenase HmoA
MISPKEIEMILSKGYPPDYITVFKAKASGGEVIEMRTTGNGFLEMVITRP